jgi:hypothetical protein
MRRAMDSAWWSFSARWSADAGDARMHVAAAEVLGADHFAGGGLHQRRAAEEDRALVA